MFHIIFTWFHIQYTVQFIKQEVNMKLYWKNPRDGAINWSYDLPGKYRKAANMYSRLCFGRGAMSMWNRTSISVSWKAVTIIMVLIFRPKKDLVKMFIHWILFGSICPLEPFQMEPFYFLSCKQGLKLRIDSYSSFLCSFPGAVMSFSRISQEQRDTTRITRTLWSE